MIHKFPEAAMHELTFHGLEGMLEQHYNATAELVGWCPPDDGTYWSPDPADSFRYNAMKRKEISDE